jgi:UrcA family protein
MKLREIKRGRMALVAVAAIAALGVMAPVASAQDDEIIVQAPYSVRRDHRESRQSGGVANIERISVSRYVSTRGLDLRSDRDADELFRRMNYAAREACDEADTRSFHQTTTRDSTCIRDAMRFAAPQAHAAIHQARKYDY